MKNIIHAVAIALTLTGFLVTLEAQTGKPVTIVDANTVSAAELAKRRKAWKAPPPHPGSHRGYASLYFDTVLEADEGVDFYFLGSTCAKR